MKIHSKRSRILYSEPLLLRPLIKSMMAMTMKLPAIDYGRESEEKKNLHQQGEMEVKRAY